jgi:tartrate-resistant acid phosphatase type 5
MTTSKDISGPITRREAIRGAVIFSTGAWAAGHMPGLRADAPQVDFSDDGLHVLALGDYGMKGNADQRAVADRMASFSRSLGAPLAAVLAIGDNFYRKITDKRFETDFEKLYSADDLNCPFYACAGNHDYGTALYDFQEGKLQLELDYARNNPTSRWKFPAKWYAVELPDAENPLVKIITLDGSYWAGALTPQEKIDQRRWFKAELEKGTKAPWLWVVNHYPLFSECVDRGDNKTLIREWGQLLKEHPVSLCLAGHDHTLQHLQVEGYSTSFIVSGAGGARLYDVHPSKRGFANNRCLGFTHIHATPKRLEVQFINADGERLHAFRRDREGKVDVVG